MALTPPPAQPMRARRVLGCAALMTLAALALCVVVLLGGSPQGPGGPVAAVRAPLGR